MVLEYRMWKVASECASFVVGARSQPRYRSHTKITDNTGPTWEQILTLSNPSGPLSNWADAHKAGCWSQQLLPPANMLLRILSERDLSERAARRVGAAPVGSPSAESLLWVLSERAARCVGAAPLSSS